MFECAVAVKPGRDRQKTKHRSQPKYKKCALFWYPWIVKLCSVFYEE